MAWNSPGNDVEKIEEPHSPPRPRRRERSLGIEELMADLASMDPPRPEPEAGIDPAERALLVQLYRELVGTVEGPVVPFPVELMEDPELVEERPEPAPLLDLGTFRARRAEQDRCIQEDRRIRDDRPD